MSTDLSQMSEPLGLLRLGYAEALLTLQVSQWSEDGPTELSARIVEEVPVALVYNGIPHVVMMATPVDLEDFALGFSLTEELIRSPADLKSVELVRYSRGVEVQATVSTELEEAIAGRARRLTARTGCGICGADSVASVLREVRPVKAQTRVRFGAIQAALNGLGERQSLNRESGAVHAAGWADLTGRILTVREDVGRHNALDKLIGALLRQGADPGSGFLIITSRASFEMVQKATVLGTPLLAAVSGPTGLAVRVAHHAGLTLVGFARPGRLTVYANPERLTR